MNDADYQILSVRFREVFDRYKARLSSEGRENVEHFLEVAELEMSCESFVLSVMEDGVQLSGKDKKELMVLSKFLGLDRESVFRGDFWTIAGCFLGS